VPGPFALKLASYPGDPRFQREAELLSRIRDPRVPRLRDMGWYGTPGDMAFPYLVMDWVEGVPLYEWASRRQRTSREVLRVLAQVARALQATHAAEGLHRDVKGHNVLVRAEDSEAVLIDFGAGTWRGAPPLTWQSMAPGTPVYRSPEALRFHLKWRPHLGASYSATPADDVYALGVTAYRLVTGDYPPCPVDPDAEEEGGTGSGPELEARVTVCAELAELIRRMLSPEPSARGSTMEIAEALEHAERTAGRSADLPITAREDSASRALLPWLEPLRAMLGRASRLTAFGVGAVLTLCAVWLAQWAGAARPERQQNADFSAREGSTIGLADSKLLTQSKVARSESTGEAVARDMPKNPFPGQARAPCRERFEEEINGGCWVQLGKLKPPCGKDGYEWNGACYWPSVPPKPPPNAVKP
jgi:hypothetical protein